MITLEQIEQAKNNFQIATAKFNQNKNGKTAKNLQASREKLEELERVYKYENRSEKEISDARFKEQKELYRLETIGTRMRVWNK
jgi:hypothetical protein